nr:hypothetical protein [uncultured Acetatifactor sp.]
MAIEYTLLCKDRKLSIEILVKKIESLGLSCSKIEHQAKGICIDLSEEIGFYLFLFDVGNYPYNSWETTFLTEDFTSERTLQFRMDKGYFDIEKRYGVMLRILFDLTEELNEEAILVWCGGEEMCFFREDKPVLLNNESGIWSRACFQDVIADRAVCYR